MEAKFLRWVKRKWFLFLYKHNKSREPINVGENRQLGFTTFVTNEALKVGGVLVVSTLDVKRWLVHWYYTYGNRINGTTFSKEEISNHIISTYEYNQFFKGRRPGVKVFIDNSISNEWYQSNKALLTVPVYNGFVSK